MTYQMEAISMTLSHI